ncbi:MAG: ABC transporter substrate-binding protein [Chloroflexota bacterium]|nr:ABC transporter substrate-binding protein [Chloroflexota bacterium]
MPNHWFRNPRALVVAPVLAIMALAAVACGAAATATPVPTAAPTEAPAPAAEAMPEPTAMPEAMDKPEEAMMDKPDTMAASDVVPIPDNVADFYGEVVYGGTLRINYEDPLEHANAWGAASGVTDRYRMPTGALLVMENPYDSGAPIIPDLAQSWELADGLDAITFNFRPGTTWHNGDAFTCEDARFSFETMRSGEGITASYMQSRLANVDTFSCADDMTLEMQFTGPSGESVLLLPLANRRAQVFNKAWFEAGGEEAMFQDVSVGLGPFMWREDQQVGIDTQYFDKNPDYYFPGLPYVDELVINGILDESTQQATQLAHQTDWHWVRNWGQYQSYVDHEQIATVIRATRGNFRLWINARNAPFDNVKVRQAVVMAIDRRAGIQVLQDGHGAAGGFGYAPGSPWELSQEQRCSVPGWCVSDDMEATRAEARAILEGEGFDFEKTYSFTVESDAQVQARSTFLQEQLRLVGIQTDFDLVETIAYREQEASGTWGDLKPGNSTVTADDPNAGVAGFLRCDSAGNYWTPNGPCDDGIVSLLDQAQTELDPAARLDLAHQIELAAMNQYSSFPVYWEQEAVSFWPEVNGYSHFPAPNGSFLKFMHLWIDPADMDNSDNAGQISGVPGGA